MALNSEDALLLAQLKRLWSSLQGDQRENFRRSLPFGDGIVDRWERAELLGFGSECSIYDSAVLIGDVSIGEGTWVGPNTLLDGSGGLTIGSYCSISAGVQIYSHNSVDWALTGGQAEMLRRPTHIGDRCYVGPNAVIEMGVSVGSGCVIGAFSLVRESLPEGSRAWGQPSRIVPRGSDQ